MPELVLDNVTRRFRGGVVAVRDLTLAVEPGELMVLVGPSGCGKTTTLRLIAGLERPTSGSIHIDGRLVNDVAPRERDVAMVFQDYALYPHMTVRANLAFAARARRDIDRAARAARVAEAAALLAIEPLLDRRPHELSGGEQQRAAVARALVRRPRCLLLDEPLSNLDLVERRRLRAELRLLHQRLGLTTIHVTHDQEEAMSLADRLAVMAGGTIHQVGAPLDVYRRPANRFVAGFVGSPPMSFIDGHVQRRPTGGRAAAAFIGEGFDLPLPAALELPDGTAAAVGLRARGIVQEARPANDECAVIEGLVELVEPLGDRIEVHVAIGTASSPSSRLVASLPSGAAPLPGERIRLVCEIHPFDPGPFGRRLVAAGPPV